VSTVEINLQEQARLLSRSLIGDQDTTRAQARVPAMTSTIPVLQIRNMESGAWMVHAQFPDGTFEEIVGFKSESDANAWIATDLQRWLDERTSRMSHPGAS
jgi:hypothetical protein